MDDIRKSLLAISKEIEHLYGRVRGVERRVHRSSDRIYHQTIFLTLVGLRGYWPMNTLSSSGSIYDLNPTARHLTPFGQGQIAYRFPDNRESDYHPYWYTDGTSNALYHADVADHDILGTEAGILSSQRGLSIGGWFYIEQSGVSQGLAGKYNAAANYSYLLACDTNDMFTFIVSNTGAATVRVNSAVFDLSQWYFVVGTYRPSTSITIYVNGVRTHKTTAIPASLFNGTAEFNIGSYGNHGTAYLKGRCSQVFLCASYLNDDLVNQLYLQTRRSYGV
jgi:hypothetical protein